MAHRGTQEHNFHAGRQPVAALGRARLSRSYDQRNIRLASSFMGCIEVSRGACTHSRRTSFTSLKRNAVLCYRRHCCACLLRLIEALYAFTRSAAQDGQSAKVGTCHHHRASERCVIQVLCSRHCLCVFCSSLFSLVEKQASLGWAVVNYTKHKAAGQAAGTQSLYLNPVSQYN